MFHVKHRGADGVGDALEKTVSRETSGRCDVSRETFLRKKEGRRGSGKRDSAKQPHASKNRPAESKT
jgi:hypothetical protein